MAPTMENKPENLKPAALDSRVLNILEQDIVLRAKQLELETAGLEIKKQQDHNMYSYALKALEVKAEDNKQKRNAEKSAHTKTIFLVTFIILMVSIIICLSLRLNKIEFATEIIKATAYIVTSGFGGYGIASYRHRVSKSSDSGATNLKE